VDKTNVTVTLTVDKTIGEGAGQLRSREVVETTIGLDEGMSTRVQRFQQFTDKIRRSLNVTAAA